MKTIPPGLSDAEKIQAALYRITMRDGTVNAVALTLLGLGDLLKDLSDEEIATRGIYVKPMIFKDVGRLFIVGERGTEQFMKDMLTGGIKHAFTYRKLPLEI